jgi:hypothetical protein
MKVLALAAWIAAIGWFYHRRQVRRAEAETEMLMQPEPTQPWRQPETTLWRPDQTMPWMPGLPTQPTYKPMPESETEPWASVGWHAVLLFLIAVVIAMFIVGFGLG